MFRSVFLVLSLIMALFASGQNLIPNGSFEVIDTCPYDIGQIGFANGWFSPTICTPDLFHECAYPSSMGIPTIPDSIQAFDGEGMGRIVLYSGTNHREYVSTGLTSQLETGSEYVLSMNMRVWHTSFPKVGSIGVVFTTDSINGFDQLCERIDLVPSLQRNPDSIMNQSWVWYHWADTLIATGNEMFMTIGNFLPASQTPIEQGNGSSSYLIDDIRLIKIEPDGLQGDIETVFTPRPNPASSTIRISTYGNERPQSVFVSNPTGQVIRQEPFAQELDVSELPPGVYFLRLLFDDGSSAVRRFVRM